MVKLLNKVTKRKFINFFLPSFCFSFQFIIWPLSPLRLLLSSLVIPHLSLFFCFHVCYTILAFKSSRPAWGARKALLLFYAFERTIEEVYSVEIYYYFVISDERTRLSKFFFIIWFDLWVFSPNYFGTFYLTPQTLNS